MLTGFPRTRWPRRRFSESYAVRISVKVSRIWEFRVIIMGVMTDQLGCCSSSTVGSRVNDCIIRPAPSGARRTTPSQPGHYPLISKLWGYALGLCIDVIKQPDWFLASQQCITPVKVDPNKKLKVYGFSWKFGKIRCVSFHSHKVIGINPA